MSRTGVMAKEKEVYGEPVSGETCFSSDLTSGARGALPGR